MTETEIQLVRESWERVRTAGRSASDLLFAKLFDLDPTLRTLFAHSNLEDTGDRLMMMVGVGVQMLDRFDRLRPALRELGERHAEYGVRWEHFATFGEALLLGLADLLGTEFTPDHKAAWVEVYTTVATAMHSIKMDEVDHLSPELLPQQMGCLV
jgi:hemoglobin-like flavoprotein